MIRRHHPLDSLRLALFGGAERRNRARTIGALGAAPPTLSSMADMARLCLRQHAKSCGYTWTRGIQVGGMVAARQCRGPQTWEITHLFLPACDQSPATDLLLALGRDVALCRGERVFLTLDADDPAQDDARAGGFLPGYRETVFQSGPRVSPTDARLTMRRASPSDEYPLFRLYCATTPREVRSSVAMTFDQWRAFRYRSHRRSMEFVYEKDGAPRAWASVTRRLGYCRISMMVQPDLRYEASGLVDFVARAPGRGAPVFFIVPDHQDLLVRLLVQKGYEPVSEYVTMIRAVAAASKEDEARLPAAVPSA